MASNALLDNESFWNRRGRVIALAGAGATAVAFAVCLSQVHFARYASPPVSASFGTLLWYWIPFALGWIALSVLAWTLSSARFAPLRLSRSQTLAIVIGIAALVRIIPILTTTPLLSDDIWRYIHDGHMLRQGVNPYFHTPADLLADPDTAPTVAFDSSHMQVLQRVNNPELITIYLPVSQWAFTVLATLHESVGGWQSTLDPLGDRTFRIGFAFVDLVIAGLLMARLWENNRSPWWAVLYAWHPLVIGEVAMGGHQDVIGIALLLVSLHVVERAGLSFGHAVFSGISLGLAAAVKPIAAPLGLPMMFGLRRSPYHAICFALIAAITFFATFLPFIWMAGGLQGLMQTVRTFTEHWAFNGSVFALLRDVAAIDPYWLRMGAATVLLSTMLLCLRRGSDRYSFAGWVFVVAVLVSSTVHPWYLLWALAVLPVSRFNPVTWMLSLTIALSYTALLDMSVYQVPTWVVTLEYVPVYAVLAWSCWRGIRNR